MTRPAATVPTPLAYEILIAVVQETQPERHLYRSCGGLTDVAEHWCTVGNIVSEHDSTDEN